MISVGNTYSISNKYSCSGGTPQCWQLSDTVGTVRGSAYNWPTPANLGRTIFDIAPGSNAATIQSAINSAVAHKGKHPVVHFPAGSYPVRTTLSIPANLDVQLIGDGYNSIINFSGTGSVFKCSSPCKMSAQDFALKGNMADGFLIGTEDSTLARVQARALYIQNPTTQGNCAYLNERLTNTRVNIYGAQGFNFQSYCVTGTGSKAPSVMAGFGSGFDGLQAATAPTISVTNNGNLLINQGWFEGHASQFLDFSRNTGNFTWDGGIIAFQVPTTNTLTLNNFSGQLTMTGIQFQHHSGYINVPSATPNTNALFLGNCYYPNTSTYWNVASGGNVYAKQGDIYKRLGFVQTPNLGGTPSTASLLSSLAMLRNTLPSANTVLPTGVTDARLERIEIQYVTNGVHVKTGL